MNRRQLLLSLGAAGFIAGELWAPGARAIFLPPAGGWILGRWDRVVPEGVRGCLVSGWLFSGAEFVPVKLNDMRFPLPPPPSPCLRPRGIMEPLAWVPWALAEWQEDMRKAGNDTTPPVAMVLWQESDGRIYHVDGNFSKRLITEDRARQLAVKLPWEAPASP